VLCKSNQWKEIMGRKIRVRKDDDKASSVIVWTSVEGIW
jgi:hypothetical protein